jgi:hypothetical protein
VANAGEIMRQYVAEEIGDVDTLRTQLETVEGPSVNAALMAISEWESSDMSEAELRNRIAEILAGR